MRGSRTLRSTLLIALVGALVAAGCGGGGGGGSSSTSATSGGASAKPTTLKVGVIPIADVAPLYVGIKQGFFKQEKLTIQPKLAAGGAAIVPAVVSGDDDIGFSNTTSEIIAASKNLPIQIIANGDNGGTGPKDAPDGVLVKKGSPTKTAKDLEGKTIAVNTLNNVGPLTINTALAKRGVDYKKVKYVEIEFPDMNTALDSGRVDAVWVVEPFVSQGKAAGSKVLLNPFEETQPHLTIATYFASKQYIAKNKDVVDRFVRAMKRSLAYAQQNPDAVRQIVTTYTKIPPAAAKVMTLPGYSADVDRSSIQNTANLAKKYGFIEKSPSVDDLLYTGGS